MARVVRSSHERAYSFVFYFQKEDKIKKNIGLYT